MIFRFLNKSIISEDVIFKKTPPLMIKRIFGTLSIEILG
jgi:hypothetical protein